MTDWRRNLLDDDEGIRRVLTESRRIAVLGIKPERRDHRPAFFVPQYVKQAGYQIVPVPVYYPEIQDILGEKVYRRLVDVPGEIDMVNVFRRPGDIPQHLDDIVAARPAFVWFQLGIRNDACAQALAERGIFVVQDRCLMSEHRRLGRP
jgi:uncharacterized protein